MIHSDSLHNPQSTLKASHAKVARLFLIRHGEPRQHSDRIFLGQTDIPLSERGRDEAVAAGDELMRLKCTPDRVYSSDLLRARETAEIISVRLSRISQYCRDAMPCVSTSSAQHKESGIGGAPIVDVPAFRELNMGDWDGEIIEDIRRRSPEEYLKRGENILSYRVTGGENFYDLRERVIREFQRITREEFFPAQRAGGSCDLVIVSHLGVIHTLIAELTREDMSVVMRQRWPTGSVVQLNEF